MEAVVREGEWIQVESRRTKRSLSRKEGRIGKSFDDLSEQVFQAGRKIFKVGLCSSGYRVRITEETLWKTFSIEAPKDTAAWIHSILIDEEGSSTSRAKIYKEGATTTMVESLSNQRGSYAKISVTFRDRMRSILVPDMKGKNTRCMFANCLRKVVWGSKLQNTSKTHTIPNAIHTGSMHSNPQNQKTPSLFANMVVISRWTSDQTWFSIEQSLSMFLKRDIRITPFCDNKAIWKCSSEEEQKVITTNDRLIVPNNEPIHVARWTEEEQWKNRRVACRNRWIEIDNIPLGIWNMEFFRKIGVRCGGLLEIEKRTLMMENLITARLKVVGNSDGFVPETLSIQYGGSLWPVQLRGFSGEDIPIGEEVQGAQPEKISEPWNTTTVQWPRGSNTQASDLAILKSKKSMAWVVRNPTPTINGECDKEDIVAIGKECMGKREDGISGMGKHEDLKVVDLAESSTLCPQGELNNTELMVCASREPDVSSNHSLNDNEDDRGLSSQSEIGGSWCPMKFSVQPKDQATFQQGVIHCSLPKEMENQSDKNDHKLRGCSQSSLKFDHKKAYL